MMTFLTKNIMTLICQIEFDIKNIWMRETYLHVEIHTMCVNCRYYGEKTISPYQLSEFLVIQQLKRLKEKNS